jgi:hypothetical protein
MQQCIPGLVPTSRRRSLPYGPRISRDMAVLLKHVTTGNDPITSRSFVAAPQLSAP